jgi:hypothetical protein
MSDAPIPITQPDRYALVSLIDRFLEILGLRLFSTCTTYARSRQLRRFHLFCASHGVTGICQLQLAYRRYHPPARTGSRIDARFSVS